MANSIKRMNAIVGLIFLLTFSLMSVSAQPPAPPSAERVRERYTKFEFQVPMRDGARLFTSVYVPKDTARTYPFLLTRTPYSVAPYGVDSYRNSLGPGRAGLRRGHLKSLSYSKQEPMILASIAQRLAAGPKGRS